LEKAIRQGAFENPPDQTAALEERVRQLEQLAGKLTLENEFLKKLFSKVSNRHLVQRIQRGCEVMNLPRSTYYYKPKENKPDDSSLPKRIEELVEEFHRYGYRRITAQLHREGIPVNHKKVLRLMRERGLLCNTRCRWVGTTDTAHGYRIYPNLLPQGPAKTPNWVWIADLTYIRTFI
jgi:hypothetical protein